MLGIINGHSTQKRVPEGHFETVHGDHQHRGGDVDADGGQSGGANLPAETGVNAGQKVHLDNGSNGRLKEFDHNDREKEVLVGKT